MPKRPSPFEGEGQEGEVCHPCPVELRDTPTLDSSLRSE